MAHSTLRDPSSSVSADYAAIQVTRIASSLSPKVRDWMEWLNDEDTCMSKATINILSSLGWYIHYQAKPQDQDSSHLFEDVTVYFAAYQDAMKQIRSRAATKSYQDKGRLIIDMGDEWAKVIKKKQGSVLLRHFGHTQIRRLMQVYGDMKVRELAESATDAMTEGPGIFDEIFAITPAMMASDMRVLSCFVAK
jgi:hypothetical protein